MKASKENMDNFFRRQAQQLEETPSAGTWERLERRLDKHQHRSRLVFRRSLSMVAAISVLLTFAFLIATYEFEQPRPFAVDIGKVEIKPIATSIDPEAYKAVEYAVKYRDQMQNHLDEGSSLNRLQVRKPD